MHGPESPKYPPEQYQAWAAQWPNYDALVFPGSLGATVVDVDVIDLLPRVLQICGDTPFRTLSGRDGGGVHLWYRGTSTCGTPTPGVDVKSTGGYVVAPGALHKSGATYAASPDLAIALAAGRLELPPLRDGWREALGRLGDEITNPTRIDLGRLIDRLAKRKDQELARRLRLVLAGQVFAADGERRPTLTTLLGELFKAWPHATEDSISALFAPSMRALAADGAELTDDDTLRRYWDWLQEKHGRASAEAEAIGEPLRRVAWTWVGEHRADACEVGTLPLIAHQGKSYFVRVGELWDGPISRDALTPATLESINALYGTQIPDNGALLKSHGVRLADVVESLSVRSTTYDPRTGTMHVATAPIRKELAPERSADAEIMIEAIGGKYAAHLTYWLASFGDDGPCRALVLSGAKHTAKTALLNGVGRLWRDGHVAMRNVLGKRFNSAMTGARLAVADDDAGASEAGEALAAFLRAAVSDRKQALERKHMDVSTVEGTMRYAVATNDVRALVSGAVSYELNDESLSAFGDRLLHIPVAESAQYWWERHGVDMDALVEGDGIPRHVLWLMSKGFKRSERFWCPAGDVELMEFARVSSGLRGDLIVRIAEELERGARPASEVDFTAGTAALGPWLADDGEHVLVRAQGLYTQWGEDRPRSASARSVGLALAGLALEQILVGAKRTRIHRVSKALIAWYVDYCGL